MRTSSIPNWVADHHQQSQVRFIRYYSEFARQRKDDYHALQENIDNLLMALAQVLEQDEPLETTVGMVNDLGAFFLHRGYWHEGADFANQAVAIAEILHSHHPSEGKHRYALASIQTMRIGFLLLQGNTEQAAITLHELLEAETLLEDQMISGSLISLIAALTQLRGEDDKSLALYQLTLEQLETIDYLPIIGYLLYVTADMLAQQGKFDEALALYSKKIEIDRQTQNISSVVESLQGLARVAQSAGLSAIAEECYRDAAEIAQSISSPDIQHDTLKDLAQIAYEREEYETAAQLYEQALAYARRAGNKWAVASTLTFLAFAREELGEDVTGLLKESLAICQELNDYSGMTMALIQLGDAYQTQGNPEQAKKHFLRAADIAARIQNQSLMALACLQMGDLSASQENWEEAEHHYDLSLSAHRHFDDPPSRAIVLRGLGQARFMQNKLELAREILQMCVQLYAQLEDWENYGECIYELACVLVRENNFVQARQVVQQASDMLGKLGRSEVAIVAATLVELSKIDNETKSLPINASDG